MEPFYWKLYVNFENGLNLENPITKKSVECGPSYKIVQTEIIFFYQIHSLQLETLGALLTPVGHFRSFTHSSWKL